MPILVLKKFDKRVNKSQSVYTNEGSTLFLFEVACSLTGLDCTLRKIQPNIQVGGAKLQRTVPVKSCGYQIYCSGNF